MIEPGYRHAGRDIRNQNFCKSMKKQKVLLKRCAKNWILLLICHLGVMFLIPTTSVYAQAPPGGYECGIFKKISLDEFQPDKPAYVDRFGNQYTEDEMSLWNLNLQVNHCDQIEDFTLIFENNQNSPFSNDEMETICDLAAQFEGERSLYGKMKRNASLSGQDALADQFFGDAHTSVIGRLYEIDSLITDLGRISEADWQQLNQLVGSIDSISAAITRIDSLYAFASNASDSLALQNQKRVLTNNLQPLRQAWQNLSDSVYQLQLPKVPDVMALNKYIVSNDVLVNNRKVVNRIFLETLALGNYTATETQLNDLLAVASQCFLEGGDAVLQARALYSAFARPLQIDDTAICGHQGEERDTKSAGMSAAGRYEIKVIPNPAKDHVSFVVPNASSDAVFFVQILDLNGKIVKELNVRNGEVLSQAFLPGLYFCRVHMGEEPAQTVKFIIIP
jgi:hypothetical protein